MRHKAGLYVPRGAFIGTDDAGRNCYSDQQSAILLVAGARWGKGNFDIPWLVDGFINGPMGHHHIINFDPKIQDSVVAGLQVDQGRHCYYINPRGARGLPSHHIHVLSALKPDSPMLIAYAMLFAASLVPFTDPRAAYFEGQAQRIITAVLVVLARLHGYVTVPMLADALAGLGNTTEEWLSLEYEISIQPEPDIRNVATKLAELRASNSDSGGWEGIKGEIQRNLAFAMDDQVRKSLSPPFDFDFAQLNDADCPPCMVSIMEDLDFVDISKPALRLILTSALIAKKSDLSARPQFWCLQEIAALAPFPLAETLATTAAGYNIRAAYVVQSTDQLDNLKKGASTVIPNSCGTQIYGGARSLAQASLISRQLGKITLEYDDFAMQERARAAKSKALAGALMGGGDPVSAIMDAAHQERLSHHQSKMARDLRTVDEVIGEKNDRAYVFMPGVLEKPFYARAPRYWHRRDLAGKYLGDPFHNAPGTVEIATWLGQRTRDIITEPCPAHLQDWPQYRDSGLWSYVKGYRP